MLDVEEYMFVGAVVAVAWTMGADLLLLVSAYVTVMAIFTCITQKRKERLDVQAAADNNLTPSPLLQITRPGRTLPPRVSRSRKMTRRAMRPKQRLCAILRKQRLCAILRKQRLCAILRKQRPNKW